MINPIYHAQVDLLLRILPYVAKEEAVALKGGTAINLFVRDMPRLSVDIDLTYLPFDNRIIALKNISEILVRIEEGLKKGIPDISVTHIPAGQGNDVKLNCQLAQAHVKIEINTTTRGHLFPVTLRQVSESVENEFGKFTAINIVSQAELYGGKVCAALDRQHPKDLFDVQPMLDQEQFITEIKPGFLMFLMSHARPMHELLEPNLLDQRHAFENQFEGMSSSAFTYKDFEITRERLIRHIQKSLTENDKTLLMSFKEGTPDWHLYKNHNFKNLPAVQWKLRNIQTLLKSNPKKHAQLVKNLANVLNS
jgi:predicted nucleotidyltransferase component of viral defense system